MLNFIKLRKIKMYKIIYKKLNEKQKIDKIKIVYMI